VDSLGVVVVDVLAEEASQMILAEHDDMVQEFASHTSDETLRRPILPRAPERGPLRSQSEAVDRSGDFAREDRVVVQYQESVRRLVWEMWPWVGIARSWRDPPWIPSFDSSSRIFQARQWFSVAMRTMRALVSSEIGGLPGPGVEIERQ
jgi:hypothetical protein